MWEADPGDWWRDLEVHVRGAFNCCRAVLPGMVERRRGRVVNIGSLVGARDEPYVTAYACAKAAFFRLTGTLAGAGRVAAEDLLTLRLREWPGS